MESLRKFVLPLSYSALLHLGLLAMFVFSLNSPSPPQTKIEPEIIKASVLDKSRVEETAKRLRQEQENKRLNTLRKQRAAENKLKKEARRLKKLKQQRIAEEQKARETARQQKRKLAEQQKQLLQIKKQKALEAMRLAKLKEQQLAEQEKRRRAAKKRAEEKRKAAEKKALEMRRKAEAAKKAKAAAEKKRRQAEALRRAEAKRKAEQAKRAAEQAEQAKRAMQNAMDLIERKVKQQWTRPSALKGKFKCTLRIKLYPGGGVMDARVIKSSGNDIFDRSAQNAVYKADPLPVPKDTTLFSRFKSFKLVFKPD